MVAVEFTIDVQSAVTEPNIIKGNSEGDLLLSTDGVDWIYGNRGYDSVYGMVQAMSSKQIVGQDQVYAGSGDDVINADEGDDTLHGQRGDDYLEGDAGSDSYYCNRGMTRIRWWNPAWVALLNPWIRPSSIGSVSARISPQTNCGLSGRVMHWW